MVFADRRAAGRYLAETLPPSLRLEPTVVLALPRGGVPVGFEVAASLRTSLDVFVVRKLGVPGHQELALGAIASGGVRVLNREVCAWYGLREREIARIAEREQCELERREREYRDGRAAVAVEGRTTILVDDGLATGASMRAAIRALRIRKPARVIVAVPVAAAETCAELEPEADMVLCASTPSPFGGVGAWYEDFSQTGDDEVRALLAHAATMQRRTDL